MFRRFRHLAVYLVVFLAVAVLDAAVSLAIGRMRPAGIPILGPWQGYAQPSRPVVMLALVLAGAAYALVPGGVAARAQAGGGRGRSAGSARPGSISPWITRPTCWPR